MTAPRWARELAKFLFVVAIVATVLVIRAGSGDSPANTEPSSVLTCPERLEALAERRGNGFVVGVDPEYDARMDWDGDGVSCE